jgi:hypothetical protein
MEIIDSAVRNALITFILFFLHKNEFFYLFYSGTGDILNGSIPQPIPKMKWISTQRNTLPTANPMNPIPIGGKESVIARVAVTTRLMAAVIVKYVGVHDWPLKQHHRRLEERRRGKLPAAELFFSLVRIRFFIKKTNTCF